MMADQMGEPRPRPAENRRILRWLAKNVLLVPVVLVPIILADDLARGAIDPMAFGPGGVALWIFWSLWLLTLPVVALTVPYLLGLWRLPPRRGVAVSLAAGIVIVIYGLLYAVGQGFVWADPRSLWLFASYPLLYSLVVRLPPGTRPPLAPPGKANAAAP